MRTGAIILATLLALVSSPLAPERAFAFQEQDRALELRKEKDLVPYREIVRRAESQFQGRVVGQRLNERGNIMVYELRILREDGNVIIALYNAHTGRVISSRGR